jgi:crotonobetainyl-CoA:carnitine CoA-transferase CaiB-like acyl-CoA transferase
MLQKENTKRGTRCRARQGKTQLVCGVCTGVVPSATMQSKDGKYVIIGGNGDSVYSRLMAAVGRPDMSSANPLYATNTHRCQRADEIYKV